MQSRRASRLYAEACAELGGAGSQDLARAYRLFEGAALAGSLPARYRLGQMLTHGVGVRRNIPEALKQFGILAAHGYAAADSRWRWLAALEGFLWSRASLVSGSGR